MIHIDVAGMLKYSAKDVQLPGGRYMKVFFAVFVMVLFISLAFDAFSETTIVDGRTGKYLGNLNSNQFDPNSVSNPYGRYGSRFSQDSINNPYGQYGSKFSNDSPNNPYGSNSPIVIDND